MRNRILASCAVAIVGAVVAVSVWAADKPKNGEAKPDKAFEGKAIWVQTKLPTRPSTALEEPQLKRLGERWFVVGKPVGVDALSSRTWIPLEDVVAIEEFSSREEMGKYYRLLTPPKQPAAPATAK